MVTAYAWILASLTANAAIIATEYLNRNGDGLVSTMSRTWPLILLAQTMLFISFNRNTGASHWFAAWAVFTIGNAMMRISAVAYTTPQEVASWTHVTLGIAAMIGGALFMKTGLSGT